MKCTIKSLLLLAMACHSPAVFADEAAASVTRTVSYENGTLSPASGNWRSLWTSTETQPQVTINTTVNNIKNDTSGPLKIAPGQMAPYTIVISTPDEGWVITGFSFTVSGTAGKSIVFNGTTTQITTTAQNVVETDLNSQSHTLSYTGNNSVASFADFTVTLAKQTVADAPALVVDVMPADDANCVYKVTDVTNGKYNDFTAWYHMQSGKEFFAGANAANVGKDASFADEYLYCFVKEGNGYAIYNKAEGKSVLTYADGKVLKGSDELSVNLAQQFLPVNTTAGKLYRNGSAGGTNMWRSKWASDYVPEVTFGCSSNNLTTTASTSSFVNGGDFRLESGSNNSIGNLKWSFGAGNGMHVYSYTFLAKKNGSYSESSRINTGDGAVELSTVYKRFECSVANDLTAATFVQSSINLKGVIMSDCYVTVRRILTNHNDRVGYNVFPIEGVERRIPAIARVYGGENAGRLVAVYDYRHNGGDIGMAGNISLQISVSDDNGETWSAPDYCRDAEGKAVTTYNDTIPVSKHGLAYYQQDPNLYWDFAFGDAAIVADRESGKLLLMAVGGPTLFWGGRYDKPNQCASWWSEDGGQTWSEPVRVTYNILDLFNGEPEFGKIDSQFIGSGKIMQSRYIKKGDYYRIYAVIASQNNGSGGTTRNYVIFSDDFGVTWGVLGGADQCPVATGDGDECKTEELPDGSVLLAGRRRTGNRNFNVFRYTDIEKGEGKWVGQVVTDMGFGSINACDGEIMILPVTSNETGESCYLALQSFPYGGSREFVSIAYKALRSGADILDAKCFTTWDGRYRVSDRSSCYSTMTWQADDKLGFFFEESRNGTYDGMYLNFTLEEITDGSFSYREETDDAVANAMRDQLVDLRAEAFSAVRNGYVGEIADVDAFEEALEAYKANPSLETYLALNKAEYFPETEQIVNGGVYQFISAHEGTYTAPANGIDFTQPVYLAANSQNLIATNDNSGSEHLFTIERTESGKWSIFNAAAKVYAPSSPATSSRFGVSAEPTEYSIVSSIDGKTYLSSATPTSAGYSAVHLERGGTIVAWVPSSAASMWYMQLVEEPKDAIAEVENIGSVEPEYFYDLQGRRVAKPERGLFVTSRGRKIFF